MILANKLTVQVKNGFLPHLINEIYKRNCSIRNINLLENRQNADLFLIEILYSNLEKYYGLINKISKYEDSFQIISSENELEKELIGGMLNVSGKMKIENLVDYEMNVLGATELILKMLQDREKSDKYSGISKNIGMLCGIPNGNDIKEKHLELYAYAERDAIIANRFTGYNAFPILIKLNQLDDFFKVLHGIEDTFSAIRILNLEDLNDLSLYEHVYNGISFPVLGKFYDEIPLCLLILISHLLKKNNLDIKNCTIGIIGINISSLRTVRLLIKLGFPRVLGSDNNIQLMHGFERDGGLATINENIISNSDLIIIFKNQLNKDDLDRLGTGQILISLLNEDIEINEVKEKGFKDFFQSGWMEQTALFPGILKGLIDSAIKYLDDDRLIKLSQKIFSFTTADEILPKVFSEVNRKLPELIREL